MVNRLSAEGPQSITRLTAGSAITRQAVTKHLQTLAEAGLVHDSRRGRERIWTLDAHQLDEAFVWWGLDGHVPHTVGRVALWIYLVIAFVVLPAFV